MSVLIVELYDALKDAGASEEKARAAAKAVSDNDARLAKIEAGIEGLEARMSALDLKFEGKLSGMQAQIDALKMRIDTLTWVVGINAALSVAILIRLFFT